MIKNSKTASVPSLIDVRTITADNKVNFDLLPLGAAGIELLDDAAANIQSVLDYEPDRAQTILTVLAECLPGFVERWSQVAESGSVSAASPKAKKRGTGVKGGKDQKVDHGFQNGSGEVAGYAN